LLRAHKTRHRKPWNIRCSGEEVAPERACEIFQRLTLAKTGQRVSEFVIGLSEDKKNARGVLILPLGILLDNGIEMQIDDDQIFKFKPRYCVNDGCYAFINLDKPLLSALKKGGVVEFRAVALSGKDIKIKMTLQGVTKALRRAAVLY